MKNKKMIRPGRAMISSPWICEMGCSPCVWCVVCKRSEIQMKKEKKKEEIQIVRLKVEEEEEEGANSISAQ